MNKARDALEMRVERLETRINEIYDIIKPMKDTLDKLAELQPRKMAPQIPIDWRKISSATDVISAPEMLGIYDKDPNPWAREAAENLLRVQLGRQLINRAYETYEPTIEGLKSTPEGLTAGELSGKTGKARNTEATYLKRLLQAGIVERKRQGNKAVYKLVDIKGLSEVFGER